MFISDQKSKLRFKPKKRINRTRPAQPPRFAFFFLCDPVFLCDVRGFS